MCCSRIESVDLIYSAGFWIPISIRYEIQGNDSYVD